MGISLDKFRAYGQQATNVDNNLRVGHFGRLREVVVGARGRFGKVQTETTPAQNQKVRDTLLKAMRNDLKSTFNGVFKSKSENLKQLAGKLLTKMENDAEAAGKRLTGKAVIQILNSYDDYKTELKASLVSAKHLFCGKQLAAQYQNLQLASPGELRSMHSAWTATLIDRSSDTGNLTSDTLHKLNKLAQDAGADRALQFEDNLGAIAALDRTNPADALRAATAEKCVTVLSKAMDAGYCDIGHLLDVQSQILSEDAGTLQYISDNLDEGVLHPLPRNHEEIRATIPNEICALQEDMLNSGIPDMTQPVEEKVMNKTLDDVLVDAQRLLKVTINGERLLSSSDPTKCKTMTLKDTDDFFEKAAENNLPKNLTEPQRELMKSHVKWAAAAFVHQGLEACYTIPILQCEAPFRLLPFAEAAVHDAKGNYNKSVELTGTGNGSWRLHYEYKTDHMAKADAANPMRFADRLVFDPKDDQNMLELTFDIDINVSLKEDGTVETKLAYAKQPEVHTVLSCMTNAEAVAIGINTGKLV